MGKSIIGMMGDLGSQFNPASASVALSAWVQVVGGGQFKEAYQPYETNEWAYPGAQNAVDAVIAAGGVPEATGGAPGYTYDRTYYQDQLDWVAPYAGTLSNPIFKIPYNERINQVTLTIYKNQVATDLVIVVDRLETGTVKGTGTLTFAIGDAIVGKITSPVQDLDDPEYVGEEIQVGSFAMTLTVTDAVMLPYRTALDSSNLTYQEGLYGPPEDWPEPAEAPSSIADVTLGKYGYLHNSASSNVYTFYEEVSLPDFNVVYCAIPLVCVQYGMYGGITADTTWGDNGWTESEARRVSQMKVRALGVFSGARAEVDQCRDDDNETFNIAIEANGSVVLSEQVPVFTVGKFSIAETYTANDGDLLNFAVVTNGDGAFCDLRRYFSFRCEFESSGADFDIHAHGYTTAGINYDTYYVAGAITVASTVYFAVFGGTNQSRVVSYAALRDYVEFSIAEGMAFSKLRCQVGSLSGGTVRLGLMVDGVKVNQYVDITTTGWHEDTTRTDTVNADGIGATANIVYYVEKLTGTPLIRFDSFTITAEVVDQTGATICNNDCPDAIEFQQLKERTLRMLGEDPDNPVYWTTDEIGRLVNDAYTVACRDSKMVQHIEQVTLVEDQAEYSLTDRTGQIFRVTYDDRVIQNITKWEHDRALSDWEAEVGYIDSYMTTLQDSRKIRTYKAWDGTGATSYWPFGGTIGGVTAGAASYTAWNNTDTYNDGDLVSHNGAYYELIVGSGPIEPTDSEVFYEPGVAEFWTDVWELLAGEPDPLPDVHTAYLNVWSVKNPILMSEPCDEPELPQWSHLGLCFAAAAKALRKYGEARNDNLASVYEAMAMGYFKAIKSHAANRTPERLIAMGRGIRRGVRRPMPWDTEIVG